MRYSGEEVKPQFTTYDIGNNLALMLMEEDGGCYAVVTVNIPEQKLRNEYCAFIDTNNCGDKIVGWLERNGFGRTTGGFGLSGFCTYPEFEFNKDIVDKYKFRTVEELFEEV